VQNDRGGSSGERKRARASAPRYVSRVPIYICFSYSHTTSRRVRRRQRWSVQRGISGSSRCVPLSVSFIATTPSCLVLSSQLPHRPSFLSLSLLTPCPRVHSHTPPYIPPQTRDGTYCHVCAMHTCHCVRARRVLACRAILADGRGTRAEFAHTRTRTMPVICTTPYLHPPAVSPPTPVPAPPLLLPTHIAPHLLSFVGTRPMSVHTYILNEHVFSSELPV
jgi:hypothetical protein